MYNTVIIRVSMMCGNLRGRREEREVEGWGMVDQSGIRVQKSKVEWERTEEQVGQPINGPTILKSIFYIASFITAFTGKLDDQ